MRSSLSDLDGGGTGEEYEVDPSDESPRDPGGGDEASPSQPPPLPPADGDAEAKAEAALRKLSPSELAGMKSRLGLDESLEGEEKILAGAVPVLAEKIRARAAAQEVTPSSQIFSLCLFGPLGVN